jgi:uncharacterized membrane protein YozB (DUF420 family)
MEATVPSSQLAWLAPLNTGLILVSGLAVLAGYASIRARRVDWHRRCMLVATAFAAAFLVVYGVRWALVGSTPFQGTGWARALYLVVLSTHVALATALAPMVLVTLGRALRGRFDAHRRIARVTLPLWLYVAASGWVVYWMLYGWR